MIAHKGVFLMWFLLFQIVIILMLLTASRQTNPTIRNDHQCQKNYITECFSLPLFLATVSRTCTHWLLAPYILVYKLKDFYASAILTFEPAFHVRKLEPIKPCDALSYTAFWQASLVPESVWVYHKPSNDQNEDAPNMLLVQLGRRFLFSQTGICHGSSQKQTSF